MEKPVRLDKFLADAGAGTRSEVKKYIQKGQVQVNGKSVKKPELKVTKEDQVVMNGQEIHAAPEYVYYLFNKPAGCVSATEDFRDKTVLDYIEEKDRRKGLFPVGRLDKDTEGFLLITDDGPLAHELLSPKKHVDKTYYAKIDGQVTEEHVKQFREGLDIGDEKKTLPAVLTILLSGPVSEIEVTIHEGRFHQIKRMFEAVGCKVTYLKRLSMGSLVLDETLPLGEYRSLTEAELEGLTKQRGTDKNE
jgi:16S rRNA pseudouridine516 synthase